MALARQHFLSFEIAIFQESTSYGLSTLGLGITLGFTIGLNYVEAIVGAIGATVEAEGVVVQLRTVSLHCPLA